VAKGAKRLKDRLASGEISPGGFFLDPTYLGSEKNREAGRKGGGYRERAGRSKKFWVKDSFGYVTCLQSSYELKLSIKLDELGIRWVRPDYLPYGNRKYFPDFYLVDYDIFVDTKNDYLIKIDADKIQSVIKQNNVDIRILSIREINGPVVHWLERDPDKIKNKDRNLAGPPSNCS